MLKNSNFISHINNTQKLINQTKLKYTNVHILLNFNIIALISFQSQIYVQFLMIPIFQHMNINASYFLSTAKKNTHKQHCRII